MKLSEKNGKLKSGEFVRLECYEPIVPSEVQDAMYQLNDVKQPWRSGWQERLDGELVGQCCDRFFLAWIGDELVGQMWYTVNGDFGTYGNVFVSDSHRGKGIANILLQFCLEWIDSEAGLKAMYLGVSNPVARPIYENAGWLPYNDTPGNCMMRRFNPSLVDSVDQNTFDQKYFTPVGNCRVRQARRADLPSIEAIYNITLSDAWFGRNFLHGIFTNTAVESQIDAMINEVQKQIALVYVLEDSCGAVLGVSYARQAGRFSPNVLEFDFFAVPQASELSKVLVCGLLADSFVSGAEKIVTRQASCDVAKLNILEKIGFRISGSIAGYFEFNGIKCNQIIMEK